MSLSTEHLRVALGGKKLPPIRTPITVDFFFTLSEAQSRFLPPHKQWNWLRRPPFPFSWGPNGPLWWLVICLLPAMILATILFATPARAETCVASHYGAGDGYGGRRTASGERMNPGAMTAAHRTLPFGSAVRVCHRGCVTVRINDRGPFVRGRCIDLSSGAARAIGMGGTARVTISR